MTTLKVETVEFVKISEETKEKYAMYEMVVNGRTLDIFPDADFVSTDFEDGFYNTLTEDGYYIEDDKLYAFDEEKPFTVEDFEHVAQ